MKWFWSMNTRAASCENARRGVGRNGGFTLLELMVVVVIIAILAAIAIPSYTRYVVKTHRTAAEGCLSEYSNYMERYYTTKLAYPASGSSVAPPTKMLGCAEDSQTGNNYNYGLASGSSSAYVLQATPIGAQLTRDTKCGSLKLDNTGKRQILGTGTLDECW